jgi:hypothetical protein
MLRLRPIEWFFLELILFLLVWIWDDYLGALISVIVAGICFAILIISLIIELIERSKVPRAYFYLMGLSVLAPLVSGILYLWVTRGELSWIL